MRHPTPGSHHFGADAADGTYIGNCMYYDLDSIKKEAEVGIVIGDRDYWSNNYGYDAVTTLLDYMFSQMSLNRIYLHTLDWNDRAKRCFTRSGFQAGPQSAADGKGFPPDGGIARGLAGDIGGTAGRPVWRCPRRQRGN